MGSNVEEAGDRFVCEFQIFLFDENLEKNRKSLFPTNVPNIDSGNGMLKFMKVFVLQVEKQFVANKANVQTNLSFGVR